MKRKVALTAISSKTFCSTSAGGSSTAACCAHLHVDIWLPPLPVVVSILLIRR